MLVHPVSPLRVLRGSRQEFLGWTPVSVKLRVPPRQSRGNSHFIREAGLGSLAKKCRFQQEDRRGHRSAFRHKTEKKVSAPHRGVVVGARAVRPVKLT